MSTTSAYSLDELRRLHERALSKLYSIAGGSLNSGNVRAAK